MIRAAWNRFKERVAWSWAGWSDAIKNEQSLRWWILANVLSDLLAFLLPLTWGELMLILSLGVLVLAMELMNTAIERTVDFISTDEHDLARRAKDAASAAVAITAIAAGVAWAVILWRIFLG